MSADPVLSDKQIPEDLKILVRRMNREIVPFIRRLRTAITPVLNVGDDGQVLTTALGALTWALLTDTNIADGANIQVDKLLAGNAGDFLQTTAGVPTWGPQAPNGIVNWTGASNTFSAAEVNKFICVSNASATTAFIPLHSVTPFSLATFFCGAQTGAGQLLIDKADPSITILTAETGYIRKQNSPWALIQIAIDTWLVMGDLRLA